jgi:hypothetical protein
MNGNSNPSQDIVSEDVTPKERNPLWRLFVEEAGVASNGWFSVYREDIGHQFANTLRLICLLCISPIYFIYYFAKRLTSQFNFLRSSWSIESIKVIHAILSRPPGGGENPYVPGQFKPRWMIKVTFKNPTSRERDLQIIAWNANSSKSYTALSYSFQDARDLLIEKYPNSDIADTSAWDIFKKDPLMTAWRQQIGESNQIARQRWYSIEVRQRNARVFLDCYLDARAAQRRKATGLENTEYVWLDEFCLYPADRPCLKARDEELSRMADIFGFASAVCVYCPREGCSHVDSDCSWGGRLWTLSEIVHTENIISLTRNRPSDDPLSPSSLDYSLIHVSGRHFRSEIQRAAELEGQWHLHAIMRHANNSGSTTWQHSIHSMVIEAIMRNEKSKEANNFLAKALNGLLPRRARPQDLLGKDGWADLAWLLELNQGFYNSASLAAVCGLGEKAQVSSGWLGPPIYPSAGNERLEPLVTAFPIPTGLFIMNPRVIGLRPCLKRDFKGLFNCKEHRVLQVCIHFLTRPVSDKTRTGSGNIITIFYYPSYRYTGRHFAF